MEQEGFCVVKGPDVLWGGDIRRFHPLAGRFDGIIGGDWVVRSRGPSVAGSSTPRKGVNHE
jgi:hypothetical protein